MVGRAVHALVAFADRAVPPGTACEAETGVDHNLVTSLTDRTARDSRVQLDGTLISPQMVEEIPEDAAGLAALRERVRRNPSVFGVLVSPDEKAALVRASFVETRLDYGALFKHLQLAKQQVEAEFPVEVYVTGQPLLFGWAYAFATEILLVFGLDPRGLGAAAVGVLPPLLRRVPAHVGRRGERDLGPRVRGLGRLQPRPARAGRADAAHGARDQSLGAVRRALLRGVRGARRQGRGVHPLDGGAARCPARSRS